MTEYTGYRQGDVYLKFADEIPEIETGIYTETEGPKADNAIILAHGEAKGHTHAIYDSGATLVKAKGNARSLFYLVVDNTVALSHEEHKKIECPPRNYKVVRQRQYTRQGIVNVAD